MIILKDKNTNVNDLKKIVSYFCDERDWKKFHNPKDLSIMISIESSELLSIFRYKQLNEMESILEEKNEDIQYELADIFFGLLRFADIYNIDLSDALNKKIEKNRKKYPKEKFYGKNLKYDEI